MGNPGSWYVANTITKLGAICNVPNAQMYNPEPAAINNGIKRASTDRPSFCIVP